MLFAPPFNEWRQSWCKAQSACHRLKCVDQTVFSLGKTLAAAAAAVARSDADGALRGGLVSGGLKPHVAAKVRQWVIFDAN